jgi:hypothetical protein
MSNCEQSCHGCRHVVAAGSVRSLEIGEYDSPDTGRSGIRNHGRRGTSTDTPRVKIRAYADRPLSNMSGAHIRPAYPLKSETFCDIRLQTPTSVMTTIRGRYYRPKDQRRRIRAASNSCRAVHLLSNRECARRRLSKYWRDREPENLKRSPEYRGSRRCRH